VACTQLDQIKVTMLAPRIAVVAADAQPGPVRNRDGGELAA
jgi:hypothetical protein